MVLVKVLKTDIKNGIRSDSNNCPIARALKRQLEKILINKINLYSTYAYINGDTIKFSRSVIRFIRLFDSGKSVKPFCFKFDYYND